MRRRASSGHNLTLGAEHGEDTCLVAGAVVTPEKGEAQLLLIGVSDIIDERWGRKLPRL